jgi:hypothetical protein
MGASTEIGIEGSARLEARFLVRREPIPGPEADWRAALVLAIPILRRLPRVVVELHPPLPILVRTAISALGSTIGLSGMDLNGRGCRHQR